MDYSKKFQDVVSETIGLETGGDKSGAFTNDPNDAGKETKWGISKNANPKLNIKTLTYKDAIVVFHTKYWNVLYELIPDECLTFKVFDLGVLFGIKTSVKKLQRSIISEGKKYIKADGIFGPLTLTALNMSYAEGKAAKICNDFLKRLRIRVYLIVVFKPWNIKYRKGWLNRINHKYITPLVSKVIKAEPINKEIRFENDN